MHVPRAVCQLPGVAPVHIRAPDRSLRSIHEVTSIRGNSDLILIAGSLRELRGIAAVCIHHPDIAKVAGLRGVDDATFGRPI